jgi:hypothetical protein
VSGPRPGRARARVVAVAALTAADCDAMFALFDRYYVDVTRARFDADLAAKDHVIALRDASGAWVGFSTLAAVSVEVDGVVHRGVFSGDTVVDEAHWGDGALGRAFLGYLLRARLRHPFQPLWWFLISKGYKTYLLMANNFPEHWPRPEVPTPASVEALRAAFASRWFGAAWRPAEGVVRHDAPAGRVRAGGAVPDDAARARPRVAFFEANNPGWAAGDELVCVASMSWTMPLRYAWKKRAGWIGARRPPPASC